VTDQGGDKQPVSGHEMVKAAAGSVSSAIVTSQPIRADHSTARVGFVVSKAVGNSVVRHRVSRQLRHLMADRIGTLPAACSLVIRALPASAGASSSELGADLDGALRRLKLRGDVV
jgi:ribonuclease P protein component